LADVADALSEISQSYSFSGITGHSSSTSGSMFADQNDFCEGDAAAQDQTAGALPQCLVITAGASEQ